MRHPAPGASNPPLRTSVLLLIFCLLPAQGIMAAPKSMTNKPKPVILAPVETQVIFDKVEALGTTRSIESTQITSTVTEKVKAIHFTDGQKVKKGQLLVELEKAEQQAELARAQAIRGERKLALERIRKLDERKLTSLDEVDRTRLELEQAEASIRVTKARINDRLIRAPFDGVVGLRNISVGALVETADLITTLDDTSVMKLDFSIPSIFLSEVRPGMKLKATASALAGLEFDGTIESIDNRIDPVTRTVIVRALVPNPEGRLLPGLLMQVDVLRNEREAVVTAEAAMMPMADRQYVMRVVGEGDDATVEKIEVSTGLRMPGYIEILDGLSDGDLVVTHGNHKLKAGDKLNIIGIDDGSVDVATLLKKKKQAAGPSTGTAKP
jgi:membrane fusion protein (multidrug efflux system)